MEKVPSAELKSFVEKNRLSSATLQCLVDQDFQEIDDIACLEDNDMKELNIPLAQRIRLREAIKGIKRQSTTEETFEQVRPPDKTEPTPPTAIMKPSATHLKQSPKMPRRPPPPVPVDSENLDINDIKLDDPEESPYVKAMPPKLPPPLLPKPSRPHPDKSQNPAADGECDYLEAVPTKQQQQQQQQQKQKQQQPREQTTDSDDDGEHVYEEIECGKLDDKRPIINIKPERITNISSVDSAAGFHLATSHGTFSQDVVILKSKNTEYSVYVKNTLKYLAKLNHPNILSVLGVIMEAENRQIVIHLMKSLHQVCKKTTQIATLLRYGLDVARGLEYLHNKRIILCDGPTTNSCWVENGRAVIGGFPVAHEVGQHVPEDFFDKAEVLLRWMSVEWMKDRKLKFTLEGDVWTYGICLWEITSKGDEPYPDHRTQDKIVPDVISGYRMKVNKSYPAELRALIENCWSEEPRERRTISVIYQLLQRIIRSTNWSSLKTTESFATKLAHKIRQK